MGASGCNRNPECQRSSGLSSASRLGPADLYSRRSDPILPSLRVCGRADLLPSPSPLVAKARPYEEAVGWTDGLKCLERSRKSIKGIRPQGEEEALPRGGYNKVGEAIGVCETTRGICLYSWIRGTSEDDEEYIFCGAHISDLLLSGSSSAREHGESMAFLPASSCIPYTVYCTRPLSLALLLALLAVVSPYGSMEL